MRGWRIAEVFEAPSSAFSLARDGRHGCEELCGGRVRSRARTLHGLPYEPGSVLGKSVESEPTAEERGLLMEIRTNCSTPPEGGTNLLLDGCAKGCLRGAQHPRSDRILQRVLLLDSTAATRSGQDALVSRWRMFPNRGEGGPIGCQERCTDRFDLRLSMVNATRQSAARSTVVLVITRRSTGAAACIAAIASSIRATATVISIAA